MYPFTQFVPILPTPKQRNAIFPSRRVGQSLPVCFHSGAFCFVILQRLSLATFLRLQRVCSPRPPYKSLAAFYVSARIALNIAIKQLLMEMPKFKKKNKKKPL